MDIGKRIDRLGMKVFGICTALLGGIILVQLPSTYEEDVDFQSKAIRATGTVVKIRKETQTHGGGMTPITTTTKYISTVKFQTNQAESIEFTTSSACSSRRNCENKEEVPVLYDPSRPSNARIDSGPTPEGKLKGGLVFGVVFLVSGIAVAVLESSDGTQWKKKPG
jgi:hypothetical protein